MLTPMTTATAIPTVEVTGTYVLDPETEDLIWGDQLEEGMVVLIEDAVICRTDSHGGLKKRWETVKWCQVTSLRRQGDSIRFIGVYDDGAKAARRYHQDYAWFVKKPR